MRIFIAEDDSDDFLILKEAISTIIEEADIEVDIVYARDGAELLTTLKTEIPPPPDFLFLDLNMPKVTGFECLNIIRHNPFHKDIRVVVLTTSRHQSDIDETYQAGADYFICKPNSMAGYVKALKKVFSFEFPKKPSRELFVVN